MAVVPAGSGALRAEPFPASVSAPSWSTRTAPLTRRPNAVAPMPKLMSLLLCGHGSSLDYGLYPP